MKFFALILSLFAVVASTVALKNDLCGLEPFVIGDCRASIRSWSYNSDINECVEFFYGGCRGNDNRFYSLEECENVCKE